MKRSTFLAFFAPITVLLTLTFTGCQPAGSPPPSDNPLSCKSIRPSVSFDYSNGYVFASPSSDRLIGYQTPPFVSPKRGGGPIYANPAAHWQCGTIK